MRWRYCKGVRQACTIRAAELTLVRAHFRLEKDLDAEAIISDRAWSPSSSDHHFPQRQHGSLAANTSLHRSSSGAERGERSVQHHQDPM